MSDTDYSLPDASKYESIGDVPEGIRKYYFEKDGKVHEQDPQAMVSTMAKIRRENEKLTKELLDRDNRLTEFIDVLGEDADPDAIKSWKEKAARADELPTEADWEKREKILNENFKKQLAIKDGDIQSRDLTIERVTINGMLREALRSADANKDGVDLLPDHMRKRVEKVIKEDGSVELHPLDEDGTRMYAEDGSEATLVDLANEFRTKRPIFFNGSRASGMGSTGESVALPKDAKNWYAMSAEEKSAFRKKHGKEAAVALMAKSAAPSA